MLDASIAIWAVLPVVAGADTTEFFLERRKSGRRLAAPMLWLAECVSATCGIVYAGGISAQEGQVAIEDPLDLEVDTVPIDRRQCRSAFRWAERLGQARAYDGFDLALVEEIQGELRTADQRLVNAARQAGATWVHGIE